jgi:hypothetical protein
MISPFCFYMMDAFHRGVPGDYAFGRRSPRVKTRGYKQATPNGVGLQCLALNLVFLMLPVPPLRVLDRRLSC